MAEFTFSVKLWIQSVGRIVSCYPISIIWVNSRLLKLNNIKNMNIVTLLRAFLHKVALLVTKIDDCNNITSKKFLRYMLL